MLNFIPVLKYGKINDHFFLSDTVGVLVRVAKKQFTSFEHGGCEVAEGVKRPSLGVEGCNPRKILNFMLDWMPETSSPAL